KVAFFNLGVIDQSSGRPRAAENNYRLALNIDPDFTPALFNLGIMRAEAGDTREAIDLYKHFIAINPNDAGPHRNLGVLLRQVGETAEGDAELRRAVELETMARGPAPIVPSPGASPGLGR